MKRVRYTKYTGDLASEMSMEDLLQALSDYLLDSGFRNPSSIQELDHTLDDLREALRQALEWASCSMRTCRMLSTPWPRTGGSMS